MDRRGPGEYLRGFDQYSPSLASLSLPTDPALHVSLSTPSITAATFYRDHLFPNKVFSKLHASERDETMVKVLMDLPTLIKQMPAFASSLASLPFLPTPGGSISKPCELYDSEVKELQHLLDPSMHFPSPPFHPPPPHTSTAFHPHLPSDFHITLFPFLFDK